MSLSWRQFHGVNPSVMGCRAIESVVAGEVHAGASRGFLMGPTRRNDLGAGVEAEALRAVSVVVAEERVLPSPEREVPHGHRDRHIDTHHPGFDLDLEATGKLARAREDRRDRKSTRLNSSHANISSAVFC